MVAMITCGRARIITLRAFGRVFTYANKTAKRYFG